MRYLEPLVGILCSVLFLIGALVGGRGWQRRAEVLLGLSGMSMFGLILYGVVDTEVHYFPWSLVKQLLAGVSIGIFVTLWLEGSANVFKRCRRRRNPRNGAAPSETLVQAEENRTQGMEGKPGTYGT